MAVIAGGVTPFSLIILVILNVGVAVVAANAGVVVGALVLVGAGAVFSGAGVWGAGFFGAAGIAY
jgi:hypothetical protein